MSKEAFISGQVLGKMWILNNAANLRNNSIWCNDSIKNMASWVLIFEHRISITELVLEQADREYICQTVWKHVFLRVNLMKKLAREVNKLLIKFLISSCFRLVNFAQRFENALKAWTERILVELKLTNLPPECQNSSRPERERKRAF